MSIDNIFEYRRDGVEIIGTLDSLIIKKNGLTIQLPFEVVTDLAEQFRAYGEQIERENQQAIEGLTFPFRRREP